jgi:hypothetical protein
MTSEGLGEVFKGDSADTCAGKFVSTHIVQIKHNICMAVVPMAECIVLHIFMDVSL